MTFKEEHIEDFKNLFEERKEKIASFEGCTHVSLLQDKKDPRIFFTYSHWDDEKYLNLYRDSDYFYETWTIVKKWFYTNAQAWSVDNLGTINN